MANDLDDTPFYRAVAEELRSGKIDDGLWLKALVESHGDEKMAHVQYTKLRVTELQEHARVGKKAEREQEEKYARDKELLNPLIGIIFLFILVMFATC